jgi:SAM-dependent methyltransferase
MIEQPQAAPAVEDVRLEQAETTEWQGAAGEAWGDARTLLAHLRDNTNFLRAAESLPWDALLPGEARVLDLGCGSGWLAALLSRRAGVAEVIAWDASLPLLTDVLPDTVALLGGDMSKVRPVCGQFVPLRLGDESLDAVAMSSAFHHCEAPHDLLREVHRVLRPGGVLVLLNEVPYKPLRMLRDIAFTALSASVNALTPRVHLSKGGHVAADHILYDEALGDRAMTAAQWRRLFAEHPFDVEWVDSGLPSYRTEYRSPGFRERNLTHFVLRRRSV